MFALFGLLASVFGVGVVASAGSGGDGPPVATNSNGGRVTERDDTDDMGSGGMDMPDHDDHDDMGSGGMDMPDHDDHDDMGSGGMDMPDHDDHDDMGSGGMDMPDHDDHDDMGSGGMDMPDHDDHDDHDDHHHGGHGDHSSAALTPPGVGASDAEISDYLTQLAALDEAHVHDMDDPLHAEHMAAMDLVPRGDADVVAIATGDWFDPAIWSTGEVPSDGDAVLIPEGVSVYYDDMSDDELFTVRVDGELEFATDEDSRMIFDTMVVSPSGRLEIGTAEDPVQSDVAVELIIANNGPINTDWDPTLLSRGLISHGEAEMHGAAKDSHEKVIDDPMAGDTSITFETLPEGWQIGDTIVIAGTEYDGYQWDNDISGKRLYPPEDEVRQISAIDGNTVYFDDPLIHDHDTPRDDLKTSVANYTRNISIETQNAEEAEIHERGHVMFMHSDDVDVRYVEFHELGRTDKSEESFDISDIDNVQSDSNVQGRYSVHLHRTGTEDQGDPAILEGNAVWGSPGWGFVHHDSHAELTNNATYDTFGAGYVAETGNETGAWNDNIAIWAQGVSWGLTKNEVTLTDDQFDTANTGDGFWFQGRLVESNDNVAASVNTGFVYFHRDGDDRMIDVPAEDFDHPDALYGDTVGSDDIAIRSFSGNETFAASTGVEVVKSNPNQGHDVWSEMDDFTAWNVETGAHLDYTAHYLLTDFDLVGKEKSGSSRADEGIDIGSNVTEVVIQDSTIDGFRTGIDTTVEFRGNFREFEGDPNYVVIDTEITGAETDIVSNPGQDVQVLTSSDLFQEDLDLQINGPLTYKEGSDDPDARKVVIDGTKTDGVGETEYPGGTDNFDMNREDVIRTLESDGYWTTSGGQNFFLVDLYFTDRATGDIYYETHPVYLDDNVNLDSPWNAYKDVVSNGVADFETRDGVTYLGDQPLDVPVLAPEPGTGEDVMSMLTMGHGVHDETMPDHTDDAEMEDDHELLVA